MNKEIFCRLFHLGILLSVLSGTGQGYYVKANTRPHPKNTEPCNEKMADIHFLVDYSTWIERTNFKKQLLASEYIASRLEISPSTTRFGLAGFNEKYYPIRDFDDGDNRTETLRAIRNIKKAWYTDMGNALRQVRKRVFNENTARPGAQRVLIVFMAGPSQCYEKTAAEARLLKESGVKIFAIGIGQQVERHELENIASQSYSHFIKSFEDFNDLVTNTPNMTFDICAVNYEKPQVIPTEVTTDTPNPNNTEPCNEKMADIFFLVDSPELIKAVNFTKQLTAIESMVSGLDISPSTIRVGLNTFSDEISTEIDLYSGLNKTEILRQIRNVPYYGGRTSFMSYAIQDLMELQLTEKKKRPNAQRVLVIFSFTPSHCYAKSAVWTRLLKRSGVKIFVIGIGQQLDRTDLETIASKPYSHFVKMFETYDDLLAKSPSLSPVTCTVD